jgi:hypothetical protein
LFTRNSDRLSSAADHAALRIVAGRRQEKEQPGRAAHHERRHLSAHGGHQQIADVARGCDRRPSPGAGRARVARGRRRQARHHRAAQEIEVEYGADPLDIGFNSRYLLDIAAQIEGEAAVLKLADPGSPTLIQDRDSKNALYVLMPMRV